LIAEAYYVAAAVLLLVVVALPKWLKGNYLFPDLSLVMIRRHSRVGKEAHSPMERPYSPHPSSNSNFEFRSSHIIIIVDDDKPIPTEEREQAEVVDWGRAGWRGPVENAAGNRGDFSTTILP